MNNIKSYDFVDCLVIDFAIDRLISSLQVIVEAYYPDLANAIRKKGLIKITCNEISNLNLQKNVEFDFDILIPYDRNGNDTKANEVYTIQCDYKETDVVEVSFKSDFLNFELVCNKIEINELDEYVSNS